jgi:hypothetical protein
MNPAEPTQAIVQAVNSIKTARDLFLQLSKSERGSLSLAIDLGRLLCQIQHEGHGKFGVALKEIGIRDRTAREYMKVSLIAPPVLARLPSIRAAIRYQRDLEMAVEAGKSAPDVANYEENGGAPPFSDDGDGLEVAVAGDQAAEPETKAMQSASDSRIRGRRHRGRAKKPRAATPSAETNGSSAGEEPSEPSVLEESVDAEADARRRKDAVFRCMAKKVSVAIGDLKKLIVEVDRVDPTGEVRRVAKQSGIGFQDVEETTPNPEDPFKPVVAKRITLPPLEKLEAVFSQVASGPND